MSQFVDFIQTTAGLATTIAGAIATVAGIFGWKPAKGWAKRKRDKWWNPIKERLEKIDQVYTWLGPNGGKSIHDRLTSMDRKLSTNDVRSQSLVASMNIGEITTDEAGLVTSVNAAVCRITNRPEADFLGRNWVNTIFEQDRARVVHEWRSSVEDKRTLIITFRWLRSDGQPIEVHATSTPVFDSARSLVGWNSIIHVNENQS